MELDKLLKKRSIISCTIKDGICIVQYASKEMKLLDISGMSIVEVLDFINSPRGFEAYCCVKESGYIFKLDMFIPAEGTLFLAIYERRQHEERR